MNANKRQRTEANAGQVFFEQGEAVEIEGWDEEESTIECMVMDNTRGFLYILGRVDASGLEITQMVVVTMSTLVSVLGEIRILESFPPGILPMVAAYVGHVARRRWKSFVPLEKEQVGWEKAEVDENGTGDVICSFTNVQTLLRVTPTGYMRFYTSDITNPFLWNDWSLVTNTCMIKTGSGISRVQWHEESGTYMCHNESRIPRLSINPSSFVMDSTCIYTIENNSVRRISRDTGRDEILYSPNGISTRILPSLTWCGAHHLLVTTYTGTETEHHGDLSLFILSLTPGSYLPHCVCVAKQVFLDLENDTGLHALTSCLLLTCSTSYILVRVRNTPCLFPWSCTL